MSRLKSENRHERLKNVNKIKIVGIIVIVAVGLLSAFFISVYWPRMPWVAAKYINNADEYMAKTYDFEVERTGWFVNVWEGNPCYRVYYRKMDGSNTVITAYGCETVDMCSDDYQYLLFKEKYNSYIIETGKEIMGEDVDVNYSFLNPESEEPPEALVRIEVHWHGEVSNDDRNVIQDHLVQFYNEMNKAEFNLGEVNVNTRIGIYTIAKPNETVTKDDIEFLERTW